MDVNMDVVELRELVKNGRILMKSNTLRNGKKEMDEMHGNRPPIQERVSDSLHELVRMSRLRFDFLLRVRTRVLILFEQRKRLMIITTGTKRILEFLGAGIKKSIRTVY